jgi:peptidoglycan lytic transglycosylase
MKRVTHLFVPSLTGCLLVASLLSSCTGIHGPRSVHSVGGPQPNTSGAEPPPTTRVQVGVASWYGKEFHGRPTASGEIYDMYQPTAAHLTAPLGTQALVTNLDNGQSVRVRINDRGPYKPRRILDLSYEAARQINLVHPGLGRVQIEFLAEPALVVQPTAEPTLVVQPTVTPVDTSPDQRHSVQVLETPGTQPVAVQVGAYQDQNNAARAQKTLTTMYPNVWISMAPEGTQPLHRVRVGPFNNRDEAERVVHAIKARGYTALVVAMAQ